MKYLVDTNVISETIKAKPNKSVVDWLLQNSDNLYLSAITIEELRFGELLMSKGKRRSAISQMIDQLESTYHTKNSSLHCSRGISMCTLACTCYFKRIFSFN